ncbi:MAG: hypothetical protein LAO03_11795 [Acidobacteriia bacterium]|nr:hypothetical protein [Terriglobia bacterium]
MQTRITRTLVRLGLASALLALAISLLNEVASAQGVLSASSAHVVLCSIAVCPQAKPVIQGFDITSVFTPGGKFVLQGTNFNSPDGQPGSIVLKIGNKVAVTIIRLGYPGYRQPYVERQTTVLGWADSHVFGQIPPDISGVMDGIATLEVWRNDGVKSDPFVVHFKATPDLQILPMADVTLKSCSKTADSNLCNNWSDSSQLSIPNNVVPTPSLYGAHALFIPLAPNQGTQSGQDFFTFTLQNGWAFDNSVWGENGIYTSASGCNQSLVNEDLPSVSTPGQVRVDWSTVCNIQYHVSLHITGPKGVPWK